MINVGQCFPAMKLRIPGWRILCCEVSFKWCWMLRRVRGPTSSGSSSCDSVRVEFEISTKITLSSESWNGKCTRSCQEKSRLPLHRMTSAYCSMWGFVVVTLGFKVDHLRFYNSKKCVEKVLKIFFLKYILCFVLYF